MRLFHRRRINQIAYQFNRRVYYTIELRVCKQKLSQNRIYNMYKFTFIGYNILA